MATANGSDVSGDRPKHRSKLATVVRNKAAAKPMSISVQKKTPTQMFSKPALGPTRMSPATEIVANNAP